MNEWIEVLSDPKIVVPGVLTGIFTLSGAFLGTYFSGKSALSISSKERKVKRRESYSNFLIYLEKVDKLVHTRSFSEYELTFNQRIEAQNMVSSIRNDNLIEKFNEINKPPNIHYQVIESYLQSITMVEYLLNDNRHDLVNSSLGTFKFCIDSMRRSTNSYIFFE